MRPVISTINKINGYLGRLSSVAISILVLLICADVLMRYAFNKSYPAIAELEWHIFSLIILFGMGFTLAHDKHVRVDVFYHRFSERTRNIIDLLGIIVLLLPFCLIMIKASMPYAAHSLALNERSADPGGLPLRWLIKYCIPLGFFFLILQAFARILQIIEALRGNNIKEENNG